MDPEYKPNYIVSDLDNWDEGTKTIDISTDPEITHIKSPYLGTVFFNAWGLSSSKQIAARKNSKTGTKILQTETGIFHQMAIPVEKNETIYFTVEGTGTIVLNYRIIIIPV